MDRSDFDALARLFATRGSRRAAFGALLGCLLFGHDFAGAAKRGRSNGKRKSRRDGGKAKGRGKKRGNDRGQRARAEAAACCSTGNCAPGPGKNLGKCCYQDQDLSGKNFKGANLGSANFAGAILTGANFSGANLGKACLVDANLTGATINGSTNLGGAIFCRTQTDNGENNSGCGKGTACCPACDDEHPCGQDEVCCQGRCRAGDCCGDGVQSTCAAGELCCDDTCVVGECCRAADCPDETCQRRSCQDHQCVSTPVFGEAGPRCQTVCCVDAQGQPVCCDAGVTACAPIGLCGGCDSDVDCDAGERCCAGTCQAPVWANLTTFGGFGTGSSQFDLPSGVAVSADELTAWVADTGNHCASVWTRPSAGSTDWTPQATFGSVGNGPDEFEFPSGVAVAADERTAWVADQLNDRVSVWALGCPA